ncbi:type II secretion system protein [Clostridium ganghwense]|uniref:Type II secretion system protein n=1 Tax=Clostridium ganghwense TaxID=312089 RepID=A0ABT4CQ05_9CLOT|nr:type II secretion system protein [Clostridium ganghwense]
MKRGFTLIELVISLSIISILTLVMTNMVFREVKNYKSVIREDRYENYSQEALRFIETEVKDVRNKAIRIENSKLIIEKVNGDTNTIEKRSMSQNKCKIIIDYFKYINSTYKPVSIVEDIKDFTIYKNKNIIYVTIKTNNGEIFERCIGLKERKEDI